MHQSSLLFVLACISRCSASMLAERVTIPAPIVVEPSQTFDGNDGPFSSFNISVGTPLQTLKVFISSSNWQTLVVVKEGCEGAGTPTNCAALRGGEFLLENSSTWQNNTAVLGNNIYQLLVDPQLGYNGRAELGFDVVALPGPAGTTLKNQTVGGFAVTDSYLGLFGIDPRSSNFTGAPLPIPSYLQNLFSQSLIPSLSWGYTAGNQYRLDKVFGSLTIGGYDRSRLVQHDGSWPIDGTNNLAVQLQSIYMTTGVNNQGLLPTPITASIDSALPYIWLPKEACLLFENAFGLVWDDFWQLYLVNETTHTSLVQQNASLTFNLGGMTGGSTTNVNITLPYAAFDLTASAPLINATTRYYPLKRAANSTQYVLGRTFFQEAYVIADYERRNFSVFPCQWVANAKSDIASTFSPIYNITPAAGSGPSTSSSSATHSGGSPSAGPIAGGVVGGILALSIGAVLFYCFYWKPKKRSQDYLTHGEKSEMLAPLPENPALAYDDPHLTKAELASNQRRSDVPELEGSGGGPSHIFELPAREETASEMGAPNGNRHEMATPETTSEIGQTGFPWRMSFLEGRTKSPSSLGSPGLGSITSPVSSPSPMPSPLPSPSMIPSSVPSPIPSPPPVVHPQPQRVIRPDLKTADSSNS